VETFSCGSLIFIEREKEKRHFCGLNGPEDFNGLSSQTCKSGVKFYGGSFALLKDERKSKEAKKFSSPTYRDAISSSV
jgi:hypothetical protein